MVQLLKLASSNLYIPNCLRHHAPKVEDLHQYRKIKASLSYQRSYLDTPIAPKVAGTEQTASYELRHLELIICSSQTVSLSGQAPGSQARISQQEWITEFTR